MRISRLEPIATSKRVTKAAPLRQRFSLAVSSSKVMPRASRPRTVSGRRTEILRSERCFDTDRLAGTMGWVLPHHARTVLEKAFDTFEHFTGCSRCVYVSAKLAAVPNAMRKPASELLHFSHSIGEVGSINFLIVARKEPVPVGVGRDVVAAAGGVLLHLRKDPGIGGGCPADHDGVAAGLLHHALGVFRRIDVAIADHGNADGLLDRGDEVPVGLAGVALHARPWMDSDGFDADGLRELGYVDGDDRIFVPAGADLDGQGNLHGGANGAEDLLEQRHVAKEAGAAALDDLFGGAAEIDVDRVVAEVFDHSCGLAHSFGGGAEKLCGDGVLVFLKIEVAQSFFGAAGDAFGAGELGHQQSAAA